MSLLMSASPWTNGNNTENRKRASTMRKTIKNREGPDEYISEESSDQMPPTIQDVCYARNSK